MNISKDLPKLLEEAIEKHRELKKSLLDLMDKSSSPDMTKAKIQAEMFKLYLELK